MSNDIDSIIGTTSNYVDEYDMVHIKLTGPPFYTSGRQWSFKFLKWFITVNIRNSNGKTQ